MDITGLLITLAIGCLCGFLAGKIFRGGGYGLIVNIILGLLGSWVGNWLLGKFISFKPELLCEMVTSILGALIILFVASLFSGRK